MATKKTKARSPRTKSPEAVEPPPLSGGATFSKPTRGFRFRIDTDVAGMKDSILNHLKFTLARDPKTATRQDWYLATAHSVRDRIMARFITTMSAQTDDNVRRVYYLSLEYLMGRMFHANLYNSGLYDVTEAALKQIGLEMPEIDSEEPDMGLGNGGLG